MKRSWVALLDEHRLVVDEGVVPGGGVGLGEQVDVVHRQPALPDRRGQHRHGGEVVGAAQVAAAPGAATWRCRGRDAPRRSGTHPTSTHRAAPNGPAPWRRWRRGGVVPRCTRIGMLMAAALVDGQNGHPCVRTVLEDLHHRERGRRGSHRSRSGHTRLPVVQARRRCATGSEDRCLVHSATSTVLSAATRPLCGNTLEIGRAASELRAPMGASVLAISGRPG